MIYLIISVILMTAELAYFKLADRFNIIDKPNLRSSHTTITLRGGGIVFYFGAMAYFIVSHGAYPWFMLGLTMIAAVSFVDDLHSMPNRIRLMVQFIAMLLMFHQLGFLTLESWWISIAALIVCTEIINAYNFMDGINGIMAGYSIVTLVTLRICFEPLAEFRPFINSLMLAAAVFAWFNFRRKALCFAGDVGSIVMGFFILYLIVSLIAYTGDATVLVFLIVYAIDTVFTIFQRLFTGENILLPHRRHLYQVLANQRQLPHYAVSLWFCLTQAVINALYFITPPTQRWTYFILVTSLLVAAYFTIKIPARKDE